MSSQYKILAQAGDNEPVIGRAYAAHFHEAAARGQPMPVPSDASRLVELPDGKRYVLLLDAAGQLMRVYRVRNDGMLKQLRRWPRQLDEEMI